MEISSVCFDVTATAPPNLELREGWGEGKGKGRGEIEKVYGVGVGRVMRRVRPHAKERRVTLSVRVLREFTRHEAAAFWNRVVPPRPATNFEITGRASERARVRKWVVSSTAGSGGHCRNYGRDDGDDDFSEEPDWS